MRGVRNNGDFELAESLKAKSSAYQRSKEKATQAYEEGLGEDVVEYWENEAELCKSLRADITQDEGSYNRFLDRDEWYERDRQRQAKKLDKKKFGTLLDGIE